VIVVDAATGTGPRVLRAGDYPVFRFQLPNRLEGTVTSVIVQLPPINLGSASPPELQLMFVDPGGGWAEPLNVSNPDSVEIPNPTRFLSEYGDLTVGIRNWGDRDVFLRNLAVTIHTTLPSGESAVFGWEGP
jgi:hypothetical protein